MRLLQRAPETRAAERERAPIIRAEGGKWGHGNVTEWGTGSSGGRVPLTALRSCSLALCGS